VKNVRHEASRHFSSKRREYLKAKFPQHFKQMEELLPEVEIPTAKLKEHKRKNCLLNGRSLLLY
jgi:hemerythrin